MQAWTPAEWWQLKDPVAVIFGALAEIVELIYKMDSRWVEQRIELLDHVANAVWEFEGCIEDSSGYRCDWDKLEELLSKDPNAALRQVWDE